MTPGEKRRRQAKRAREADAYQEAMAPLRAAGASCATCQHNAPIPDSKGGRQCELDSDFSGYTVIRPDGLCPKYSQVKPADHPR